MRVVAAVPALALLAGAALGLLAPDLFSRIALPALVFASGAAGWGLGARHEPVLLAAVVAGFFNGGAMLSGAAWQAAWRPSLRVAFERAAVGVGAPVVLTGTLRTDAVQRETGVSLSVDVNAIRMDGLDAESWSSPLPREIGFAASSGQPIDVPVRGGVLLTVSGSLARDRIAEWRAGRTVRAPAFLRRPSRYMNPGARDEERALARRGTTLVGSIKSGALVEVLARGHVAAETAARARAFVRRAIGESVGRWSERSGAIVAAIVIGDRAGLDDDVERRLQEAGTYHVIAISGGNIAILAGLTLALFRIAGLLGRAAMLAAIGGLVAYAYLVGGGPSVNRATLMAVVYFVARALDLRGPPANVLAVVTGLLVANDPLAIVDPGFLLTVGATTAIVLAVPVMTSGRLPRVVASVAAIAAASIAAEAVLFPVGAIFFSRVTLAGLVLNLAAVPLMAVAQLAGMAAVVTFTISPSLAAFVGWVAHASAEGLVRSADLVRLAPAVTWRVAAPGWLPVLVYYAALIAAWSLWRRRRAVGSSELAMTRRVRQSSTVVASCAAVWMLAEPWALLLTGPGDRLRVTFIDVGQGDATLVQLPTGHTLLVDAGGSPSGSTYDIGDRVVGQVLRHVGLRRLGSLVLSHGDADHIGGARSVAREFRPAELWEGIPVPRLASIKALRTMARESGARWTNLQAGDHMTIGDVDVLVHHPGLADWERQAARNDDSIVLELHWREVSIVLPGDIGSDVEASIGGRFDTAQIRIVKVPHHGSLTSSSAEFVRALSPHVAVVSAGRGNLFGHPAPAVLARYADVGAAVFRTDEDGAVTVTTDGHGVSVETVAGRTLVLEPRDPRGRTQATNGLN